MSALPTPGPWTVTDNSWEVSTVYGPDGETIAECPINSIVTEDNQHELEPIKEANARLIVKAPDMLGTLDRYADTLCEGWCEKSSDCANFDDCGGCEARRMAGQARGEI